jgi:hypothetical protein
MRSFLTRNRVWVCAAAFFVVSLVVTLPAPARTGVYAMEGNLVFTPPNSVGAGNAFRAEASNIVFFAAAVEREYNVAPAQSRVASTNATLYGTGVRDGSRVTLPDRGGQWGSNFNTPYLRVEVVSSSTEEAEARFDGIVTRLRSIAQLRQEAAGVPPMSTVRLELSPPAPVVQYVSGRYSRALIAGVLLGVLGAAAIVAMGNHRARTSGVQKPLPQPDEALAECHEWSLKSALGG